MAAKKKAPKKATRAKQAKATKTANGYKHPHDMYVRGIEEGWELARFEREKAKHFPAAKVPVRAAVAGVARKIGKPNPLARVKSTPNGKRAKKGVFITTSTFSNGAKEYAANVSDSIVLLDGDRLARLMTSMASGSHIAH